MRYLVELIVGIVRTVAFAIRPPKPEPRRHVYPDFGELSPIHTCYWCGRFDPLEQELTNPPCVPTRKVAVRASGGIGPAHRKVRLQ